MRITLSDTAAACPLDYVNLSIPGQPEQLAVGVGSYLCVDLERLTICGLRHRRICRRDCQQLAALGQALYDR